jgi:cytochrome b6
MPSDPLRYRLSLWLRDRLPIAGARRILDEKVVPAHDQSIWYYLGGVILLAFVLLIGTGILLLFQYQPTLPPEGGAAGGAHESIRRIVEDVPYGWWIRSIHHWCAHLMIAAVMLHLLSTLLMKAYRKPREFTWWTGLVLAALTLTAGFTGYLLPWNSLSFAATRVGAGIAGAAPLVGPLIQKLMLGGTDVSGATLTRFFGLHVVVLPLLIILFTGLHLLMMVHHGSSTPPSRKPAGGETPAAVPFWPDFALREGRAWLVILAGILLVACFLAPPVGEVADPLAPTPDNIKPEWYFLGFYRVLKMLPTFILGIEGLKWAVLATAVLGVALVGLPLLDAAPSADERHGHRHSAWPARVLLGLSVVVAWALSALPAKDLAGWPKAVVPLLAAVLWLMVAVFLDRLREKRAQGPATLFGVVLASALVSYVGWEAFGPVAALAGLALAWVCLGLFATRTRLAGLVAAVSMLGVFLTVIILGGDLYSHHSPAAAPLSLADRAPLPRVHETAPVLTVALAVLLVLLVLVQLRIRHLQRVRSMGVKPIESTARAE